MSSKSKALAETATGPLAGIRILDLTSVVNGAYATQILADQGADVIKLEDPGGNRGDGGDIMRWAGHAPQGAPRDLGPIFLTINRNKRSIVLDMKQESAKRAVRRLIKSCDVFAASVRYEGLKRLGLAYEDVAAIKPDIIYLAMSMQGGVGPEKHYLGYGATMAAVTGIQQLSGLPGREPAGTGTNYPDHIPNPCHAAFVVLAALRHRRRTGLGQHIDMAQTEPTVALLGPAVLDRTVNGRTQQPRGPPR